MLNTVQKSHYPVIIVGGGPCGIATALELGLQGIKCLVIEKHDEPLLSPRAQWINARSMEFFMRWKIDDTLKAAVRLPKDYPIQGVWCESLIGDVYAISSHNERLNDALSPQRGLRIPLYDTETVLRNRLKDFPCVEFLTPIRVVDINTFPSYFHVSTTDTHKNKHEFTADYLVAADGANSIVRRSLGIKMEPLSQARRFINLQFKAPNLEKLIKVPKGFIYYFPNRPLRGALGPIDLSKGYWYAQIEDHSEAKTIQEINLREKLAELTGLDFNFDIVDANFWIMQVQLAERMAITRRCFLVGDSAHTFAPTGGFGLNTGFGDAVNLGWKLAAVLKGHWNPTLLDTYELERRPVALYNLLAAKANADGILSLRERINPNTDPKGFALASAKLAEQFTNQHHLTLGYSYENSPLGRQYSQNSNAISQAGHCLKHKRLNDGRSIFSILDSNQWHLIISGKNDPSVTSKISKQLETVGVHVKIIYLDHSIMQNMYDKKYILLRPDWHIAYADDDPDAYLPL